MEGCEPAYLGLCVVWQCRFTHQTWNSIASTQASPRQDFICLIMQLELEEPALHPEGLVYIRACHVVKPEGLSKDSVLNCKIQFGV